MFQKNRLYPIFVILAMLIVWQIRKSSNPVMTELSGLTMGTTYSIKYFDENGTNYQVEVDSILVGFNHSLSTYEADSEVSSFNNTSSFSFKRPYFPVVLQASKEIYLSTAGSFDPTVYPLVSAWGFGPEDRVIPDSTQVDSLLQFVGFSKINFDKATVSKQKDEMKLDFSAIAKGYGVDVIAEYILAQGISDYFIEIGGEVRARGLNIDKAWRVGVENPTVSSGERGLSAVVELVDKSMATSGNYRNYYMLDGVKYAHTIDPKSGYPVEHSLLSATVFAPSCMIADAYATSFMVMGLEKAKIIIDANSDLETILIYSNPNGQLETYISDGIASEVKVVDK